MPPHWHGDARVWCRPRQLGFNVGTDPGVGATQDAPTVGEMVHRARGVLDKSRSRSPGPQCTITRTVTENMQMEAEARNRTWSGRQPRHRHRRAVHIPKRWVEGKASAQSLAEKLRGRRQDDRNRGGRDIFRRTAGDLHGWRMLGCRATCTAFTTPHASAGGSSSIRK